MNLHEKIALMIIVTALVVIAMVGVFVGDRATPEQTLPADAEQNAPQIPEYTDFAEEDSQTPDAPPFADAQDEEVIEYFLPVHPGFLKPAFASDPSVVPALETDETDLSEPPVTESSAPITTEAATEAATEATTEITTEATTEITTEATTEVTTVTTTVTTAETTTTIVTTTATTPAVTTTARPETTKAPETQKPVPETTVPKTTAARPETTLPQTEADPTPAAPDLRAAMIAIAKSQIGVAEEPYNNVKYNTWYYGREVSESKKGNTQYAWCSVFLAWCADQAGVPQSVYPKIGAVSSLKSFFQKQGCYYKSGDYTPKPGDIAFFSYSHVGVVVSVEGGQVLVVEGNASDCVKLNTYKVGSSQLKGYASPNY